MSVRLMGAALAGSPARELVPQDPRYSGRWHVHDTASPLQRWNYHPEFELHLTMQGRGRFIVGNYIDFFQPGHLVLVGPNMPHHWMCDLSPDSPRGEFMVFQFLPRWLQDCQGVLPELTDLEFLLTRSLRGIEFSGATAEKAAELLAGLGTTSGTARLGNLFGLLGTLAGAPDHEQRMLADAWLPPSVDATTNDIIDRAFTYIDENLTRDVRLAGAAALVGMSDSAFSRYFKRAAGQTFSEAVRKMRLAHACKLLRHTDLPVSAIYARVGYANLSNFNRQFRACYRMTPTEFRRHPAR